MSQLTRQLDATLTGPAPYHIAGKFKVHIVFFTVHVSFNHSWGEDAPALPLPSVDVAALLARGYWVPAITKTADGWRFVCNLSSSFGGGVGSAANSELVSTGKKLGSDKTTVVSDSLAAGNDGWWEILEPKTA